MASLGKLRHDKRVIKYALESNTFNVYWLTGGKLPKRVIGVRTAKGVLQVQTFYDGWQPVSTDDEIYQQ